jgi:hypothetical protein
MKIVYIVTKVKKEGYELNVGDHIWFDKKGRLYCREAGGWIMPEHVDAALSRVEYEIDSEHLKKMRENKQRELEDIEKILNTGETDNG